MESPADRLQRARKRAGYSTAAEAVERFGWKPSTYMAHENGQNGLKRERAEIYASAFRVSAGWLLTGEGEIDGTMPTLVQAPLVSWVSAGALQDAEQVMPYDDLPVEYAPGLNPHAEWIALKVAGSSMDRISPPDSIIFVDIADRKLVANACYVIATEEGAEATYKRYRPGPDRWEPVTFTTGHDTLYPSVGNEPRIIGRVKLSMISL